MTGICAVLAVSGAIERDTPGDTPISVLAGPGHGRGLSQHGALDSAQRGWSAERILEHYYPGAVLGAIAPTTLGVRLLGRDDGTVDVYADAGLRVAGREIGPGQAAHLTALPDGGANVVVTVGCDGEVLWQGATTDPWVYPIDPHPGRPAAEHLTFCDGTPYRGALGLADEAGAARVVNRVDVEDYLLGVVPSEVQADWADQGGHEALRAQAVAARSYALAEQRYPYARTCDTTDCQVYPGTTKEDPRAAAAVAGTVGAVLLRDGHILRAEYSAAPDGGAPADIQTFAVGPTPSELAVATVPTDPRTATTAEPPAETVIDAEYRRIGGPTGPIGTPLGPEMALPLNAGTYRLFTDGVIIATPDLGAQVVDFATLMQLVPSPEPESAPDPQEPGTPSDPPATPLDPPAPAKPDSGSPAPQSPVPGTPEPGTAESGTAESGTPEAVIPESGLPEPGTPVPE